MNRLSAAGLSLLAAWLVATLALVSPYALGTVASAQPAGAMSCDQLWYERNAIYAGKGFCFRSKRALGVFGARCYPPYGQLTPPEQNRVAELKGWEQVKGCGAGPPVPPPPAPGAGYQYMDCGQLWHARNAIYAAKGYCFKSQRARAAFGPGCFPPYGELSPGEHSRVNAIQRWEGLKGCR